MASGNSARPHPIVLGTAGHIDHGKTALVAALTGVDTDRLPAEKARGITIELGFAPLQLGAHRIAVIDVPGHERFLKSMVAGASGIDIVCLVVAADEGVMPQTREHLDVCALLGVRRGLVALSKCDRVDAEQLAARAAALRAALTGSFLADASITAVSAHTGHGLDALRAHLAGLAEITAPRDSSGPFRLPIDRVFTVRGFGTVVTGTVLGGTVAVGDEVIAGGRVAKVRGIEVHGQAVERAHAGLRAALNLSGGSLRDLARGTMLSHRDAVAASHILDACYRHLPSAAAPLRTRSKILLHHAGAQRLASLVLVDRDRLDPGDEALVQLRLDQKEPIFALPGDHFLARGFIAAEHHGTTMGGGSIVRALAPKSRGAVAITELRALARAPSETRVALEVRHAGARGLTVEALQQRLGHGTKALAAALEQLIMGGVLIHPNGGPLLHRDVASELEAVLLDALRADGALTKPALRARLPQALAPAGYQHLVQRLVEVHGMELEAEVVRVPQAATSALSPLALQIAREFSHWQLTPRRPAELPAQLGATAAAVNDALAELLAAGTLVKIKFDLYVDSAALAALEGKLIAHLQAHQTISPGQWKELTGASRKYSIPLAEHFDQVKLTLRVGDLRRRR